MNGHWSVQILQMYSHAVTHLKQLAELSKKFGVDSRALPGPAFVLLLSGPSDGPVGLSPSLAVRLEPLLRLSPLLLRPPVVGPPGVGHPAEVGDDCGRVGRPGQGEASPPPRGGSPPGPP